MEINTEELLEYLTRERTKTMWGQKTISYDCLIEAQHGDGKQLVYFQTMNSRPFYYIIRVDSSLDLDKDYNEILPENSDVYFDEMLMRMIEEEHDNIDKYEETESGMYTCDQDREEGIKPFEYKWPMFSLGAGCSCGTIDVEYYKRQIECEKLKETKM
jgi:hypothetical protein